MATLYENLQGGAISDNPLTSGATTVNSAAFEFLPTVTAPDVMYLTLDPEGSNGAPEIVKVTAHTASATSVTVVRAQQGTSARSHPVSSNWVHALTEADVDDFLAQITIDDVSAALLEEICPAGTVRATLRNTADTGWVLDNQTIADCDTTYPTLWANAPAAMKSGTSLVIPDLSETGLVQFSPGVPIGELAGSNTQAIVEANLPAHTHGSPAHTHTINHGHADTIATSSSGAHSHTSVSLTVSGTAASVAGTDLLPTGTVTVSGTTIGPGATFHSTATDISNHTHSVSGTASGTVGSGSSSHTHTVTGGVTDHSGSSGAASGDSTTGSTGSGDELNILGRSFGVRFQIKAH